MFRIIILTLINIFRHKENKNDKYAFIFIICGVLINFIGTFICNEDPL